MRKFSMEFYHDAGGGKIAQPVVFCPRCLSLIAPVRGTGRQWTGSGWRATLRYEHHHKPLWIYLIRHADGKREHRIDRHRSLNRILEFAGMGWAMLGWSPLQVAHYIGICLRERRKGRKIDALAVLLADLAEPPEAEKAEILRAIGLEGGAATDG